MSANERPVTGETTTVADMLRAGAGAVSGHRGLTAALYLAQFLVAFAAGWLATQLLAIAFADQPIFDRAVDGELTALVYVMTQHSELIGQLMWIILGAGIAYAVVSWFLTGGLLAVLVTDDRGHRRARRAVAETFGAGGVTALWPFCKLALWSLIPYIAIVIALAIGFAAGDFADTMQYAVTMSEVVSALALAVAPAAVLWVIATTAIDYARIALVRDPGLAAWRALVRGYALVFTRRAPLVHVAVYWLVFAAISALYVALTFDRPMLGAGGALAMFAIRQLVLMLRFAAKIALIAGQVELSRPPATTHDDEASDLAD